MKRGAALAALALLTGCAGQPKGSPTPPPPMTAPAEPRPPAASLGRFVLDGALSQGGLVTGQAPAGVTAVTLDGKPVPLAADGRFVIGFDRDAKPNATLTATAADGRIVTLPIAIAPRSWAISRLPTLPKYPVSAPAFAAIRPAELARIVAARATVTDAAGWRQHFRWPASGRLSTLFGSQRVYANGEGGEPHSGADIAIPTGTPVLAPADGVVILAADHPFTLEGNLLMLDHGMGLNSALLHLSAILVRPGEHVRQGQMIARSGMTGRATGPHLHWSLRWQAAKIDPLLAVGAPPPAD